MKIIMRVVRAGASEFEHLIEVKQSGDLADGAKAAFDAYHLANPGKTLLSGDVQVVFDSAPNA